MSLLSVCSARSDSSTAVGTVSLKFFASAAQLGTFSVFQKILLLLVKEKTTFCRTVQESRNDRQSNEQDKSNRQADQVNHLVMKIKKKNI